MTATERYQDYLKQLKTTYTKVCRANFLNRDGTVAFSVDNEPNSERNKALIVESGALSCNLQNGQRRSLPLSFVPVTDDFTFDLNNLWFGSEISWEEGLILSDGTPFYIPQGVFVVGDPEEILAGSEKTASYGLHDKWANLDGTLYGNLEATYMAGVGVNIFSPIAALLKEDRGNGWPVDNQTPIFTNYYNGKTQTLPDGTVASLVNAPFSLTVEPGTKADVILGFVSMINGWVGYDTVGALRVDASQDDILDATKPIQWEFSNDDAALIGLTYAIKDSDVYNDVIVLGEQISGYPQPAARAQNLDNRSDTNVNLIGRKTLRITGTGFGTTQQCRDFAAWKLKRTTVLQKAVTIRCKQIMHIQPNQLITIIRTDKPGSPIERHVVMGFSRPIKSTEEMTINCVSVNDFPQATIVSAS